ncbi:MAG: asparagine synthase C-terminal domain-containing protein [Dysgonamonadaceae bacterium]|jgi:asparagine synthase (glutamine-hydrolysing)|nr:asparagine synthase C-terminal domain-containing protein [Dysgonamonadaceae bacterium]
MQFDIRLNLNKAYRWFSKNGVHAKGYLFDSEENLYRGEELCTYFSEAKNEQDFRDKLADANGVFSVVIERGGSLWLAVDRFRYFPIFYRQNLQMLRVGDNPDDLFEPDSRPELDEESCTVFSALTYVLGNKTLLKDVFELQAGEYAVFEGQNIRTAFYHKYFAETRNISFEDAKTELKRIIDNMGRRTFRLIDGRPAAVSLSGGLDSRLVACILKKSGIKNVVCYTFGVKTGNPELERSETVARKLGFDWHFVDYSTIKESDFYKQKTFLDFCKYTSRYVSKFGFAQYFACKNLIENKALQPGFVHFTGDGGDFFAGSHLRPYMLNYKSISQIAKDLQYIHCDIAELSGKERKLIFNHILKSLDKRNPLFGNVENWDLKERQAKYIINTTKLWEFYGLETQVPLCDKEFADFFAALPFEYRMNQKLYKTVLHELFEEFDINFPQDVKTYEKPFIQQIKKYIKRTFPFLRKKTDLYLYDFLDMKRFLQPVFDEIQKDGSNRKILSFNGILSEWYLQKMRNELT